MADYKQIWERSVAGAVKQEEKEVRGFEMHASSVVAQRILLELAFGPEGEAFRNELTAGELDQFRDMLEENFMQDESALLDCVSTRKMSDYGSVLPQIAKSILREVKENRGVSAPVAAQPGAALA